MLSIERIALIFVSLSAGLCATAQDLQLPINIQSPNAASLGKYGDVPVSLYTGTPNVSVPLFNTNIKGIGLNISLNYDASGVRPDNHPGWVGQNWSLDAGGVITRTVEGFPDEDNGTPINGNTVLGNPILIRVSYFSEVLKSRDVDNYDLHSQASLRQLALDRATNMFEYPVDFEPDVFTFNFMGISGKFFMGMDGKWKVSSETNLEILFDPFDPGNYTAPFIEDIPNPFYHLEYDNVIFGFKIRDDKGNVYTFGYDQDAIEYSIPFWSQIYYSPYEPALAANSAVGVNQWVANSWNITSVVDRYGNKIYEFKYSRDNYIASFIKSYQTSSTSCSYPSGPGLANHHTLTTPMASSTSTDVLGSLISPVYLTNITSIQGHNISFQRSYTTELAYTWDNSFLTLSTPLFKVHGNDPNTVMYQPLYFIQTNSQYSTNYQAAINAPLNGLKWMELNTIAISRTGSSGQQQLIKQIDLLYNNNPNERLNLIGATVLGSSRTNKYSYTFKYDRFNLLPPYLSERVDHWGYYRGDKSALYLGNNYYDQRESNSDFLSIGLLSSIEYPTGGTTTFQFEPHDYSKIVKDAKDGFSLESGIAGGVRIKSITDFDGANSITRNFKYVLDFISGGTSSSGILAFKPTYFWDNWTVKTTDDQDFLQTVFSTNNLVPLGNSFGPYIGYSEVTEIRSDGATTVNKFTGNEDFMDEMSVADCNVGVSPYKKFSDRSFMRGKLFEKFEYDASGQLKRKSVSTYRDLNDATASYTIVTNAGGGYNCPAGDVDQKYFLGQSWKIYWLDYDVLEEEVTTYFPSGTYTENVKYTKEDEENVYEFDSPFGLRLTKSILKTVSGDQFATSLNYALDLAPSGNGADFLKSVRDFGEVIETIQMKNGAFIGTTRTNFRLENSLCVPDSRSISSTSPDNNLYTQLTYDKYDNTGNLLQYTLLSGITTSIIWSYNNQLPVAEITGATYDQVVNAFGQIPNSMANINFGFGYSEDDFRSQFEQLRSALPGIQIKFYTYNSFGISSIVDANGQTTYYEYDDIGRLKRIKDLDKNIVKNFTYNFK